VKHTAFRHRLLFLAAFAVVALAFGGCAFPSSRALVPRSAVNTSLITDHGTVTDVRLVTIEGQSTAIGHNAGLIGLAAGSGIGHGAGRTTALAVGLVIGEALGVAFEERLTRKSGETVTVRLDNGRLITVTQAANGKLHIGDDVTVISDGSYSEILAPGAG
jgi:outer membrane lipoprotein SlyB